LVLPEETEETAFRHRLLPIVLAAVVVGQEQMV
jgi:hypothetical protein